MVGENFEFYTSGMLGNERFQSFLRNEFRGVQPHLKSGQIKTVATMHIPKKFGEFGRERKAL